MMPHRAFEKGIQVPLLAANLAHTANIHAVDLSVLDTAYHTLIPIAQRAVPFIIDAAADYHATIVTGLPAAGIIARAGRCAVTGNARIHPCTRRLFLIWPYLSTSSSWS